MLIYSQSQSVSMTSYESNHLLRSSLSIILFKFIVTLDMFSYDFWRLFMGLNVSLKMFYYFFYKLFKYFISALPALLSVEVLSPPLTALLKLLKSVFY